MNFKPIPGFDNYQISQCGTVIVNAKGKKIKPWQHTGNGGTYLRVTLYDKGTKKNLRVHRAVAMAFIPNLDNLPEVNHKDEDTFNNAADNLEWVAPDENKRLRY